LYTTVLTTVPLFLRGEGGYIHKTVLLMTYDVTSLSLFFIYLNTPPVEDADLETLS